MLMFGTIMPETRLINRKLRPLERSWVSISSECPFPEHQPEQEPKMLNTAPDAPAHDHGIPEQAHHRATAQTWVHQQEPTFQPFA
jgi:hypothetical protein